MNNEHEYHRDTVIQLQSANRLKNEGRYQEAVQILQAVIATDPQCAPAYNNLGVIYYACADYYLAANAYQAALDIRPDYLDAYYNLGLASNQCGDLEQAISAFQSLLKLKPDHVGAHFQMGNIYLKKCAYECAASEYQWVLSHYPEHFESLANFALCNMHLGKLDVAGKAYVAALQVNPDDSDIIYNLGVIHMQQGYATQGLTYYLQAVQKNPDYFDAHYNLAAAYLMRRDYENARLHFKEALRIKPDDEVLQHTLKILQQDKTLTGSSPAYIQSLFDSYADHYEPHLRTYLHYQVPEKLKDAIVKVGLAQSPLHILDLGCGTGLCGELFIEHAKELVGVDLSPKMLVLAEQKHIYQELIAADVLDYLGGQSGRFDLVLAADVLVYFGELRALLCGVRQALAVPGVFAFNVELGAESDFELTSSGRFAHDQAYLERLAAECGFEICLLEEAILRQQDNKPVNGYICIMRVGSGAS